MEEEKRRRVTWPLMPLPQARATTTATEDGQVRTHVEAQSHFALALGLRGHMGEPDGATQATRVNV